jgi:hypothetical protein
MWVSNEIIKMHFRNSLHKTASSIGLSAICLHVMDELRSVHDLCVSARKKNGKKCVKR